MNAELYGAIATLLLALVPLVREITRALRNRNNPPPPAASLPPGDKDADHE